MSAKKLSATLVALCWEFLLSAWRFYCCSGSAFSLRTLDRQIRTVAGLGRDCTTHSGELRVPAPFRCWSVGPPWPRRGNIRVGVGC